MRIKNLINIMYVLCITICLNCFVGSRKDACKYNLRESTSASSCDFIAIVAALGSESSTLSPEDFTLRKQALFNSNLLSCYQYYEKLQECEKEEYKYMPAIYGINSNPASDALTERIASGK
ncbi:hypothetical protein AB3N59_03800 [Leptospira sp. WS92.C1]